MKRSINRTHTHSLGRQCPNGLIYRRACEMMDIDPDNNPNYKGGRLREGVGKLYLMGGQANGR